MTYGFLLFLLTSLFEAKTLHPGDCFCSDLNLNSPGLTLHSSVPYSTSGPSTGCAGFGGCTLGHRTIWIRKDLLAAKVIPQEGGCRWQETRRRGGLFPWLCPTAVRNGWGELGLVLFLPITEKTLDDIQPLLTGLSAVLT